MEVVNQLTAKGLRAGIVRADDVAVGPTGAALEQALTELVAARAAPAAGDFPPADLKEAVRALLRTPAFKPSGRSKPASEYLAQAAREGRFPRINNLVDALNFASLASGLPISLLDADVVGSRLVLRHGRPGERYVFNATGQEIDLDGLICACASDAPLGNPIKDSLAGKIKATTRRVVAVVYAPDAGPGPAALRTALAALETWLGHAVEITEA